ncbi:hypothetical protein [Streptomyces sp. 8N706]|uniref:hypothetical protein n=1 Tax=Streptomyces sp. 8N706 TaxID=3457416 RepID=UPI003FD4CF25
MTELLRAAGESDPPRRGGHQGGGTVAPVDSGWWAELDAPVTDVLQDSGGQVLGVVSYATRPRDGAGLILWLHCLEEDQALTGALIDRVLDRLGRRTVHAFEFASALSLGLEGLPVRNRPAIHRALEAAGFSGKTCGATSTAASTRRRRRARAGRVCTRSRRSRRAMSGTAGS